MYLKCYFTKNVFVPTEKVGLMFPDNEVQKSDVSSSSHNILEKEALGPLLLEVHS